jgi:hypothetical protein
MIYRDGKSGPSYIKDSMFQGLPETKHDLTMTTGSQVVYFHCNQMVKQK